MNNKKAFFGAVFITLFFLTSCNKSQDSLELYDNLNKVMKRMNVNNINNDDIIVVINMKGCSVCYSRALYFLENNTNITTIHYIVTGFESKKNLAIRLGNDIISNNNVHLDSQGIVYSTGIHETYPLIFYRIDGKLSELEIADLNNKEAYNKLSNYISNRSR